MKILYHHRTASSDGQAVHIEEMILAMKELGHEIKIVSPQQKDNNQMGNTISWVEKLRNHSPKHLYEIMELTYSILAYYRLFIIMKQFKPDILYERYNLFMIAGAIIHKLHGLPFILEVNSPLAEERSVHGGLSFPRLAAWIEGMVWRSANIVLPVTHVLANYVEAYGVPKNRIHVIPNGINLSKFSKNISKDQAKFQLGLQNKLILGFTGFVRDWHGMDKVLYWMKNNNHYNVHLLIVGDGPARLELENLAKSLKLESRISFTGVIPRDKVPNYIASFDIALQPSVVSYASPLKLFEYMALAKPIIAPDTPNLREILENEKNALLFNINHPSSFESALNKLCSDSTLRNQIGNGARDTIDKLQLTWIGNAMKVEKVAKQLLFSNLQK